MSAGVAIFCFDRLDKLDGLLKSLRACDLFSATDLWIFHDGVAEQESYDRHQAVRMFLRDIPSDLGGANIFLRDTNMGLRCNITDGIQRVLSVKQSVIVLEDDLILHRDFLRFMCASLEKFEDNANIFSVNGFVPSGYEDDGPFFSSTFNCWGWATWRSKWIYQDLCQNITENFKFEELKTRCDDFSGNHWSQIYLNRMGRKDTWAINAQLRVWRDEALCVYPPFSLVANIGNDGSGENSWSDSKSFTGVVKKSMPRRIFFDKALELKPMSPQSGALKKFLFKYTKSYGELFLLSRVIYSSFSVALVKRLKFLQDSRVSISKT